jgi:hypothetical protein
VWKNRPTFEENSDVFRATNAADAAITIGTRIRAPIAALLPVIAKIEVMLTWNDGDSAL